MKHLVSLLVCVAYMICLCSLCAEDEINGSISSTKILLEERSLSIYNVATILRKTVPVDLESDSLPVGAIVKDNHVTELTVDLKGGETTIGILLGVIKTKFGYDYKINDGTITLFDPHLMQPGFDYPLNGQLDDIELENVTAVDAINTIAKKLNFPVTAITYQKPYRLKQISIHLSHVSIREAFDKIVKSAGLSGWNSNLARSKARGLDKPVVMIML